MVKRHLTADLRHFYGVLRIFYRYRLVHCLEDTLQVSDVVDKVVEDISKVHDRLPEVRCVAGNRHDGTERFAALSEQHKAC